MVIGVHIKYDQAVTELYNITSVYDAVQGEWPSVKVDKIDVTFNSSMLIILIVFFSLENSYSNQGFSKFHHRHKESVSKYNVRLKCEYD